jgi:hypothetical protein
MEAAAEIGEHFATGHFGSYCEAVDAEPAQISLTNYPASHHSITGNIGLLASRDIALSPSKMLREQVDGNVPKTEAAAAVIQKRIRHGRPSSFHRQPTRPLCAPRSS